MTHSEAIENIVQRGQSPDWPAAPGPQQVDATGHISGTVLVNLAERAATAILPRPATLTDIKTLLLEPTGPVELSAQASLRHQTGQAMLVEVELRRPDETTACLMALTFTSLGDAGAELSGQASAVIQPLPNAKLSLRERRVDALVAAATQVIGKSGFASATMRDIAKAAGTHVPTLYDYFLSKEALLEAIYRREMEAALECILRDVDRDGPAAEQLLQVLTNQIRHAAENRRAVALLNREFRHLSEPVRADMAALYRKLIAPYNDIIALGIARGEFRTVDPFVAANVFETAADLLALRPFFFRDRDLDDWLQALGEVLIGGLTEKPDSRPSLQAEGI
ncbi:MAG: TetR family transcriptional regulator [Pseudomonadota bacterium]